MTHFAGTTACIVDDHPIFRQGLCAVLQETLEIDVIAQGACATEAIALAARHCPDIMILDLTMPGGGLNALREIMDSIPSMQCILLTACDEPATAIEAMSSGAKGYILKGVGVVELEAAIDAILHGGTFVSPSFAAALLQAALSGPGKGDKGSVLTHRETQVLTELERGRTNREIAKRLAISEKTVKFYMTNIMQKYGVKNRLEAVIAHRQSHERALSRQTRLL
ncbi:chemotaxis protein CheY [Thioclava dalianensis]|uniref:Chemotaxis protein CheY n=1 Tax=Thioclava dalianensis TaxID=1185766 RepID=A0A074TZW6_9RHOB|nr:response regulator transcription factor [Thioclava dalianensis]KEP67972.1 chemotaxis protein CheY [Thioclava dalianensis]SFN91798.1 two-component system, NarL family, nitrate/nitrite response regulator NarL [Thioclava dalianensis]